jgi:ribosomal protein L4
VAALKSFRNLPEVDVVQASEVGVAALIGHGSLVLSQAALEQVSDRAKEAKR